MSCSIAAESITLYANDVLQLLASVVIVLRLSLVEVTINFAGFLTFWDLKVILWDVFGQIPEQH